jgi:hypothetical protein
MKDLTQYATFEGIPNASILRGIVDLYCLIFGFEKKEKILERYQTKEDIFTAIALQNDIVVGFKIGYRINAQVFYRYSI